MPPVHPPAGAAPAAPSAAGHRWLLAWSVLVGLSALAATALPLSVQAAAVTIDTLVEVPRFSRFQQDSTDSLDITASGELRADGRYNSIGLAGFTINRGRLQAGWNNESLGGLGVSGQLVNQVAPTVLAPPPTINAMRLVVSGTGRIDNRSNLNTGIFTQADGSVLAFASPVDLTRAGVLFDVMAGGQVSNAATGNWANRADGRVLGTLVNEGSFNSTNLPGLVVGNQPYQQVIRLGYDDSERPLPARQGAILNRGSFRLDANNTLLNAGSFHNSGTAALNGADMVNREQAEWVNTGTFDVALGGRLVFDGSTGPAENSGLLRVATGGTLSITDYRTRLQNLAGGELLVAGTFDGDGRLVNNGQITVHNGGSMALSELSQNAGNLRVDGSLRGDVRINGGTLSGGGYRHPVTGDLLNPVGGTINGSVYLAGTGPAEALASCTFAAYACLRPGNSPGRLNILGELTMDAFSILELEVERDADGALVWDQLFADVAHFGDGSLIRILLGDDVTDLDEHQLDFIHCDNGCSFAGTRFEVLGGTGRLQFGETGLFFTLPAGDDGSGGGGGGGGGGTVPEPAGAAWLALGAAALATRRRRRRAAAGRV